MRFKDKTVFITGASRGIGKAIGLKLASEGANIIVTGKSDQPHPKLPGTIHTAVQEMKDAGGNAIAIQMDVRNEELVENAVAKAVEAFGGIDILVNNASAINLSGTLGTSMKSYDLMNSVNVRGTFLASQKCIPHLKNAENPHILNLSPPLNMNAQWFAGHVAYTMAKYGMSMCVLGMAEEFKNNGIAINALWPKTTIKTAAVNNLLGGEELMKRSRTPQIVADAAAFVLARNAQDCTGNFFIDEDVLASEGVTDLSPYSEGTELMPDLFLD